MISVRLLAVFAENKPGQTARVAKVLADSRVNVRWVTIANSGPFGIMKFLVNDPDRARQLLTQRGLMASFLEVLAVEVEDKPGGLCRVAECLATAGINLDNTSGFVANGRAVLIIETHQLEEAEATLVGHGLRLLTQVEMLEF